MTVPPVRLTIYSDYLSPWCFNTLVRLKQLRQKWGVQMTWKSFMLMPEETEPSLEAFYLASQSWSTIANEPLAGEFKTWPPDEKPPNWSLPALVAAKVAATFGETQFSDYQDALMVGYFRDHYDISDATVLLRLAENCGMDRKQFEKRVDDPQWKALVWEEHHEAKAAGIHNIPMVVVNDEQALAGTVSVEDYETAILKYCEEEK